MDGKRISLKIDLRNGIIELDAPSEDFDEAVTRTKDLASGLEFGANVKEVRETPAALPREERETETSSVGGKPAPTELRKARGSRGSSGRPGRIGSFEEVLGMLTEPQEKELRAFFTDKAPSEQLDRIIVAIVKGEELLGRKALEYNEIYTLMRLGGVKPLPKAIDVVLTRLLQDQYVVREGAGFSSKFLGREYVEEQLPKKGDAKA